MQGFEYPLHGLITLKSEQYEHLLDMGFFIDEKDEVSVLFSVESLCHYLSKFQALENR